MPEPPGYASPRRWSRQLVVLLAALALWSLRPVPALWALLAAYAVAWLLLNALLARGWTGAGLPLPGTRRQAALLLALLAAAPVATLLRALPELRSAEALHGLGEGLRDRRRLEDLPAIAPPMVFADRPQPLYVHAPGARRVSLRLGAGGPELPGADLGAGLFRVAYDPARDGPPQPRSGELRALLRVDGRVRERRLEAVRPLAHPRWLASDPAAGLAAAVSEETDELFVVGRRGLLHRVALDDAPSDCAFFAGGTRLAVSHRHGAALSIVDPRRGEVVARIPAKPFQARLAVSPDGSLLAVAIDGVERGVQLVSLPDGRPRDFVPLDFPPDWLAFGPGPDALFVSSRPTRTLHRLLRRAGGAAGAGSRGFALRGPALRLGRPAVTLARAPGGRRLVVATTDFRADGRPHRGNHFVEDQILWVDTERFRVVGRQRTSLRTPRQDRPGNVDGGGSPIGIAPLRDGSLLVAFAGTDELRWLRAGRAPASSRVPLRGAPLRAPHGVAELGAGVFAASSPASGTLVVFSRSGERIATEQLAPSDEELARTDPPSLLRRLGEHVFYESTRSGISCQSCHLHADSDHSFHNIVSRAPTRSVRGVAGTAPYLRDASFPRVADLVFELAQRPYRGYLRRAPDRATSLEHYVRGLALPVNPSWLADPDPARDRAGVAAFAAADCARCHAFPAFTNLGQHAARSIWPGHGSMADLVDTPSLFGVGRRAPYLHDGRAETLDAVLREHNPEGRHGNVAALSDAAREVLLAFLGTL